MEHYVEQAKALVETMRSKGAAIGIAEGCFVEKYAFYTEDFSVVRELANEFANREYEKEYGTIDGEFIKEKHLEIVQKNAKIENFATLTRRAGEMIGQGYEILGKIKEYLRSEGLLMDYEQYVVEQEMRKRRDEIREEFSERGKGGKTDVRSR